MVSTSGWTITARTIGTSNGAPLSTLDRERDRRVLRAADLGSCGVGGEAGHGVPSIAVITSPGWSPAFSAGEPVRRARRSRAGSRRPAWRRWGLARPVHGPDRRPDPLELAGDALERGLNSSERHVQGVGVVERADHPLDRALDQRLLVDRPTRVAVRDRRVRVPERLEGVGRARRGAGRQRGLAAEREPGDEQGAAGEDGGDAEGADEDTENSRGSRHGPAARQLPGAAPAGPGRPRPRSRQRRRAPGGPATRVRGSWGFRG